MHRSFAIRSFALLIIQPFIMLNNFAGIQNNFAVLSTSQLLLHN